jgi:hypothetical protein
MHWNLLEIKKEAMFLFGIGYKDLVLFRSIKGKEFQPLS